MRLTTLLLALSQVGLLAATFWGPFLYGKGTYDFVIIGAGSAGCASAARLTENATVSVLVIEAGGFMNQTNSKIPLATPLLQKDEAYNWKYTSEQQPGACQAMINQTCAYPRGKGLGGSSQINAMMYVRGNPLDFDQWAAENCTGWDWQSVLPYFKKSEGFKPNSVQTGPIDSTAHGTSGPMTTEFPRHRTPYADAFVNGGQSCDLPKIDYNAGTGQIGVSPLLANTDFGVREYTGQAFCRGMASVRPNFAIAYNSLVTKINFNGKTCTGVSFTIGGVAYKVMIGKELILSGGAINTPQLLMLSGIGPAATLTAKGIEVLQPSPVGQFMPDHWSFFGPTYTLNTTGTSINFLNSYNPFLVANWGINGGTQLSLPYGIEALAFGQNPSTTSPPGVPDYELMFTPASYATDYNNTRNNQRISDAYYNSAYKQLEYSSMSNDTISTVVMLLKPKSIGSMTLKDSDPMTKPLIYHNALTDPFDMDTIIAGIRMAQRIFESDAFKPFAPKLWCLNIPGCTQFACNSTEHWQCAVRAFGSPMYHEVGTCRMGDVTDPTAVVGPDLKVHGIERVRCVDSSAFRDVTRGHTAAPTMMIAEKACDMIKAEHGIY